MISIPTLEAAPHQDLITNLEGKDYAITLRYNGREGVYYIGIGPVGGAQYGNTKLVCNWPLFVNRFRSLEGPPPGVLMCVSMGLDDSPPALGELGIGRRCELVYLESSEATL